jgi:serine/threonine-protein kinase RsbW
MATATAPEEANATRVAFHLPATLEVRHLAINLVSALIEHVPTASRQFRDELITAFGEAFNNIVAHGYKDQPGGALDVEADLGPEEITLRLIDRGRPIDFARVNPPDLDSMPQGGLGVFMIYALVDEVAYRCGAVNVLSLTKRTSSSDP